MYCPDRIVLNTRLLCIIRHERTDYYHGAPWREVLNPLRYEIRIGTYYTHVRINQKGRWAIKLADAIFRVRQAFTR